MSKIPKVDRRYLIHHPKVFVEKMYHISRKRYFINKNINILFSLISILAGAFVVIFTAVVFSGLVTTGTPDWFFYGTTGVSAAIAFLTSLFNFFYVKENVAKYKLRFEKIRLEITKYKLEIGEYKKAANKKDINLFENIMYILGYTGDEDEE